MVARLVSKAEYARLRGISKAAVTKKCRGAFKAACEGDRVNIDHPLAKADLGAAWPAPERSDGAPTGKAKRGRKSASDPTDAGDGALKGGAEPTAARPEKPPPPPQVPAPSSLSELEEIKALLAPLTDRFGTSRHFRDWLLSLKDIEVILEKHLRNEQAQGELISRELVKAHVFGALQGLSRKLLQDSSKTIARRLAAHFASKGTVEEAEAIVRENIGSQIAPVKEKAIRVLRATDTTLN